MFDALPSRPARSWLAFAAVCALSVASPRAATAARPFAVLHTAITEATEGKDLEVNANIPRYRDVSELVLRYRVRGSRGFRSLTLKRSQSDFFEAKIPAKDVKPPAVEYYLFVRVRDGADKPAFASAATPQVIKVSPASASGGAGRTALEEELAVLTGEEEVVSAARVRQRIEESPSAITVITAEDIKNYGSTSIAEVLRTVPGMDFMQISAADPNLSARGFNKELSARLLTLIDGRSAYIDIFGNTFWEVMPISVWDIDRIEVIRGPGSTLYGANAFGGVVNIFTKKPDAEKGAAFYTQGGANGFNSTLTASGRANKHMTYRMSTTFDSVASFDRNSLEDKLGVRANAHLHFDLPIGATLDVRGGMLRENLGPIMSLNGPFKTEATMGYAQLNFDWKDLHIQAWYTGFKADILRSFPLPKTLNLPAALGGTVPFSALFGNVSLSNITGARPDTLDFEATYNLEPVKQLRMVYGLNYRYNQYSLPTVLEPENKQHLFGVFGQFEIRPHRTLNINLGARADVAQFASDVCPRGADTDPMRGANFRKCLAGDPSVRKQGVDSLVNFAPRGSLVWGFHRDHYVRVSGGLAFRNPSYVEKLVRFEVAPAGSLGPALGGRARPSINFVADETLGSERIASAELGYGANFFGRKLRVNLDMFYLEGSDLISFRSGSLLAALSGQELSSSYVNLIDARNYGFELSLRANITTGVKAFVNYSWQRVELKDKADLLSRAVRAGYPAGTPLADITTIDTESPMHKLNFGVNLFHARTGLFANLYGHFVGATKRANNFTSIPTAPVPLPGGAAPTFQQLTGGPTVTNSIVDLDAYFLFNANMGYRFYDGQLEVGVSGFNVFGDYGAAALNAAGGLADRRHLEYPRLNLQGQSFGGEAIGARVFAFLRGQFK